MIGHINNKGEILEVPLDTILIWSFFLTQETGVTCPNLKSLKIGIAIIPYLIYIYLIIYIFKKSNYIKRNQTASSLTSLPHYPLNEADSYGKKSENKVCLYI